MFIFVISPSPGWGRDKGWGYEGLRVGLVGFISRNMKEHETKANESKNVSVHAHKLLIYINNSAFPVVFLRKDL